MALDIRSFKLKRYPETDTLSDQEDFTDLWDLVRALVTSQYIHPLPRKEWVQDQGLEENDSYLAKFHRHDNSLAVYLDADPNTLPFDISGNAEEISKSLAELKSDNKPFAAEIRRTSNPRAETQRFQALEGKIRETASQTTPTTYDTQEHQPQTATSLTAEDPSKVENVDPTQE